MSFLFSIIVIVFLLINGIILYKDWKWKIIPNLYLALLLLLLPFFYYFGKSTGNIQSIIISDYSFSLLIIAIISIGLFLFNGWAAGDSKYTIVLSFFVFDADVFRFAGNIAVITMITLLITSSLEIFYIKARPFQKNESSLISRFFELSSNKKILLIAQYLLIFFLAASLTQIIREYFSQSVHGSTHSYNQVYSLILLIFILLIRYVYKLLFSPAHIISDKRSFITLTISLLILTIIFLYRGGERFYYDILEIVKFALPTVIIFGVFIYGFSRFLYKRDLIPKKIKNIHLGDRLHVEHIIAIFSPKLPENSAIKIKDDIKSVLSGPLDSHSFKYLNNLCSDYRLNTETTYFIIHNTFPYAHVIFLGFLITAVTDFHLSSYILTEWAYLLKTIYAYGGTFF